jgi:transaldolase
LGAITDVPVCFEVFSDDLPEMELQALEISSWGENVYVKVPVTNTRGVSTAPIIERLSKRGVKLNVTAVMLREQLEPIIPALKHSPGAFVSIFAGRIADTGRDPIPLMREVLRDLEANPNLELIWASPREVLNLFQADEVGCHIITVTNDILSKLTNIGKDLDRFSLETVQMFYDDARAAGYTLGETGISNSTLLEDEDGAAVDFQ